MNRKLYLFDLDHTLVVGNSSFRFFCFLLREQVLSPLAFSIAAFYYYRYHYFGYPLLSLHQQVFNRLLKGRSAASLQMYVDRFVEHHFAMLVYMPAVEQLRLAQQTGAYTAICSNSPDFLVSAIAKFFLVDGWKATSYLVDEAHQFSQIAYIVDGEKKREYLEELREYLKVEKSGISAYSDSYLDLPFLLGAGNPYAVNPNAQLKAYALTHNWPIL